MFLRKYTALGLTLSMLTLPSCALLPGYQLSRFESLIEGQRYDEALTLYQALQPEEQNAIDLEAVQQSRQKLEEDRKVQINKLLKQHNYVEAEKLLADSLALLPESAELQELQTLCLNLKEQYIERVQKKLDLARAEYLIEEAPFLNQLALAQGGDRDFVLLTERREREIQALAERLGSIGLNAYKSEHFKTAKKYLTIAEKLHPDSRWQETLNAIAEYYRKQKQRKQAEELAQQQAEIDSLKQSYLEAFNALNMSDAKKILTALEEYNLEELNAWIKVQYQKLDATVQKKAQEALAAGHAEYVKGNVAQAISIWTKGLELAPEHNELKEALDRAIQFQRSYLELQSGPQ